MPIAYLINQYPQVSHSFIRREIAALEARGMRVERFTLRRSDGPLVDASDQAERDRTRAVLDVGAAGLMAAMLSVLFTRPRGMARALRVALRVGWRGQRGLMYHAIYLAEACVLLRWWRRSGVRHVHTHFGTNSTTVAMLCRCLGGPTYSFTAHGPEEFDAPAALALGEKVRWARFAVVISDFGRSQLYRWADFQDWGKIHVVRCGVDAGFLTAERAAVPAAPRLVCVGRLAEQKGQLLLVRAAGELREAGVSFELVLVGDGPMRAELAALIDRLGLRECVRITGWMSNAEVRAELEAARALVLPSFAEGLPVVIMEALALGRPVISTYVAGIPELVTDGVCGWLVPAGSVEALAAAMRQALEAPLTTLQQMGEAGARRVRMRHDAAMEAGRLARLMGVGLESNHEVVLEPQMNTDEHGCEKMKPQIHADERG